MTEQGVIRLDRLVIFDDEIWVLDYKRNLLDSEHADYALQLEQYRGAVKMIYPHKTIRSALITVDGRLHEM